MDMRRIASMVVGVSLVAGTLFAQDQAPRGMQVYAAQKCSICHSIADKGNKKGPLDSVGTKLKADEIRQWIVDAPTMTAKAKAVRKPAMKAYASLPKEDLDGLVAYLQTLKQG
jgi:mono/diheme cytochrome c family protein